MGMQKMGNEQAGNHENVPAIHTPTPAPVMDHHNEKTPAKDGKVTVKKSRHLPSPKMTTKTVEIKLAYPTLPSHPVVKKIKNKVTSLPRKRLVTGGLVFAAALIAVSGYYLVTNRQTDVAADKQPTRSPRELAHGAPDYPTRLPAGKKIDDLGGWTLVSPPDRSPVYAYVDHIGETQINVSEQPLPSDLSDDPASQIELLARGYKASEKVTVGDTTAYIGTSSLGPQSVIFYKDNLLILIKSSVKIPSDKWAGYINSLL